MKRTMVIGCLAVCLLSFGGEQDNPVQIPPEVVEKISHVLSEPVISYRLDEKKNQAVFERITGWVKDQMTLDKRNRSEDRQGEWICYREMVRQNQPILLGDEAVRGVEPSPFHVFYVEENHRRIFRKEMWVPVSESLSDEQVIRLARGFLNGKQFVAESEADRMGDWDVLSWKQQEMKGEKMAGEPLTAVQRATCSRTYQGRTVVNSRQIVEVHPVTKELVGYKSLDWTPVDETSARLEPAASVEEVIRQIGNAFAGERELEIESIAAAWIQTDDRLLPILEIRKVFKPGAEGVSPNDTILVSLVEKTPLETDPVTAQKPENYARE